MWCYTEPKQTADDVLNSLAPGKFSSNFKIVISEPMLRIKFLSTCEVITWMTRNTFDDNPTLIIWAKVDPVPCLHMASLGHRGQI